MNSSFEVKEKIREAIDIVDLVSRYVPSLQRKGRIYVGRCPWHDDNRPSLQVNPDRQTYRCWVCNLGGDIFSFIEQIEGVDFKEALEILADMAGIPLPKPQSRFSKSFSSAPSETLSSESTGLLPGFGNGSGQSETVSKSTLYKSLRWLADKYHQYYLSASEAAGARQYISERGITEETAKRFTIGYSPLNTNLLLDWIGNSRSRALTLIEAGVLAVRQNFILSSRRGNLTEEERSALYDRFHGRVIFPILDTNDRIVAFGGRILPNSALNSPAKYINSPETPVFIKSKMFYGLNIARNAIRAKKRVLITEGYTDTIMAHQFGFEETVAVLGTALGSEHVKILNRFADKIYLILDGDAAGQRRASEVLGFFVAQGADMSVLTLPDNSDPCEFLLVHGKEAFEEAIKNHSISALDHAFQKATEGIDPSNIIESSRALDSLLSVIALAPLRTNLQRDPVQLRISMILRRMAEKFHIGENEINQRLNIHRQAQSRALWQGAEAKTPSVPVKSTVPIPQFDDETPEILATRFGTLPDEIWKNRSFMPNPLEVDFFTSWWACPEIFPALSAGVTADDFISPVSRQIFLLGVDLLNRGAHPVTFDMILRRYDSPKMISCLDAIAEKGTAKDLSERLAGEGNRKVLVTQILDAFLSRRIERTKSTRVNDLRNGSLDEESKDKKLLELQRLLKAKQQRREEQEKNGLMDEDVPDDAQS
ncbi:MAG: toprim domain-containing protein [Thermoguttaceae bacterium]|nr:toprim domain-containing protein [Thermoguttaceae bacterium]